MSIKKVASMLVGCVLLVGCGSDEPETKLLEPQRRAMEKAEAVEGLLQENQRQQQKAMEEQGI